MGGVAIAVLGFAGWQGWQKLHPATKTVAAVQTVPATRRSIVESVTLPGTVGSGRTSKLSFASSSSGASISGIVKSISVKTGDTVTAGQEVAQLDTTSLDLAVKSAQSSLTTAQIKMQQLLAGALASDAASAVQAVITATGNVLTAQNTLTTAQTNLNAIQNNAGVATQAATAQQASDNINAQLVTAQAAVSDFIAQYKTTANDAFGSGTLQPAVDGLVKAVDSRCSTLATRDACVDAAMTPGTDLTFLVTALNNLPQVGPDLLSPLKSFNDVTVSAATAGLRAPTFLLVQATAARAGLAARASNLALAQSGSSGNPTADALASAVRTRDAASQALEAARAGYNAAVAKRDQVLGGPLPTDIALQEQSISQASIALQKAQNDRAGASLIAPYAGVIGAITMNVGEQSGSGSIVLIDQGAMQLQASSQESDIAKIKVGQTASLAFDAYAGVTVPGVVISVAPDGTITQGVASYAVVISANAAAAAARGGASGPSGPSGASGPRGTGAGGTGARAPGTGASGPTGPRPTGTGPSGASGPAGGTGARGATAAQAIVLRSGMTGTATVEIQRHDNVLTVPSRAVKRSGRNSVVTVVVNGQQESRTVTTGASDTTYTEITSGLNEGDQVVVPSTGAVTSATGASGASGVSGASGASGAPAGGPPAGGPPAGFQPGG